MLLPRLVEYLSSILREDGTKAFGLSFTQTYIATFLPGASASYVVTPVSGFYADIDYYIQPDLDVVPNTFDLSIIHSGDPIISGTIMSSSIQSGEGLFVIITDRDPVLLKLTNNSTLAQFWRHNDHYLIVRNYNDFVTLKRTLDKLGSDPVTSELQNQARILSKIADGIK